MNDLVHDLEIQREDEDAEDHNERGRFHLRAAGPRDAPHLGTDIRKIFAGAFDPARFLNFQFCRHG